MTVINRGNAQLTVYRHGEDSTVVVNGQQLEVSRLSPKEHYSCRNFDHFDEGGSLDRGKNGSGDMQQDHVSPELRPIDQFDDMSGSKGIERCSEGVKIAADEFRPFVHLTNPGGNSKGHNCSNTTGNDCDNFDLNGSRNIGRKIGMASKPGRASTFDHFDLNICIRKRSQNNQLERNTPDLVPSESPVTNYRTQPSRNDFCNSCDLDQLGKPDRI